MPRKEMKSSFLAAYVKYASANVESRPEYHYACALAALSSAIGNRTFLDLKGNLKNYNADLWFLMIGPAGISRKTTAIRSMKGILPKDFHQYPQDWTWEAFVEELAEENTGLWIRDEFGGWLANNQKRYMAGATDKLRRLYDNAQVTMRTKGGGSTQVDEIALSVLLGSTPGAVAKYMNVIEEMENGLLSRILLVSGSDIVFKGLWLASPNQKKLKAALQNKLIWVRKRSIACKRVILDPDEESAIKKAYNDFFFRLKKKIDKDLTMASVYQRMLDTSFKIGLIFAMDEKRVLSPEQTLTLKNATDAIELVEGMLLPWYIKGLEEIKASYSSLEADKSNMEETKLLKVIQKYGSKDSGAHIITRSMLYKYSHLGNLELFDSRIRSMIETKAIYPLCKAGSRGIYYAWTPSGKEVIPPGYFQTQIEEELI